MDYSLITDDLLVGTTPSKTDYDILRDLGVGLVINMRLERKPYSDPHIPPLELLWLPSIDWKYTPIPIQLLVHGARKALQTIHKGNRVYTHCAAGRHRGVAMGASVLIAQGFSAEEAMQLLEKKREIADPRVDYIRDRIIRFAEVWNSASV